MKHSFIIAEIVVVTAFVFTENTLVVAIRLIHHSTFEGMRIGEAAHPGPRLRRRGPCSWDSRAGRRRSGEESSSSALVTFESQQECRETCLEMLHFNLRGYISHIAEVTALLREMRGKPFVVNLNETFLSKAIDNVEFEGYQVLARRNREGQWLGGVLVFVMDEYFTE